MRVEFSSEVLSDSRWYSILDRIVHFFDEERHVWHSEDPDAVKNSDWFSSEEDSRSARMIKELFEKSNVQEEYTPTETGRHSICIVVSDSTLDETGTKLAPNDAYEVLSRPGYIAVEDARYDSEFIHVMINAFNRYSIYEAIEYGWLEFVHMGGCSQLEQTLRRIRRKAPGPMRTFALVDSDRFFQGHETENVRRIDRWCTEFGADGWALNKREIENYIPLPILHNLTSRRIVKTVFRAFRRLSQEQRDYFDMKEGFKRGIPSQQNDLYSNISPADQQTLEKGFGDNCKMLFAHHQDKFTPDEIISICPEDPDEIPRILDSLERLI